MAKTVKESKFTEWKGLDRISSTVHEMKCFWRELTKDDFGIDGEIEIVVPKLDGKGYETHGNVLKVQAKSGDRYVRFDTETSFASPVEKADLEGWNNSRYPVLYIVYHPKDDKLYAKEVRGYVKGTVNAFQPPCRIQFEKATDEFNVTYFSEIRKHADVSEPRVSFQQKEELLSNLFPVRRLPALTHASTEYTDIADIRNEAKGHLPPICIHEGRLFTLADLRTTRSDLRIFCDGDIESLSASEWMNADPDRQGDYVFLLNQLIGKIRYERGLRYNRDYQRTYFPRPGGGEKETRLEWFNVRTMKKAPPRTVVRYYEYGLDRFWRHLACHLSFLRFGSSWFLRIIPKYFYTLDGETPCDGEMVGSFTTRQKAKEHNMQVLNHVLFWADYLASKQDYIAHHIDGKMILNIDRAPLSGLAPFAIPSDPATYEEKPPPAQLDLLFGVADEPDGDMDD
jgi:hypothetical protein